MSGLEQADIAIIGGGPAGMQAALVLARTRKKVVVFDDPAPPRNAASHGVHNFLGVDGMLPADIRELAWKQIGLYESSELRQKKVIELQRGDAGGFVLVSADGGRLEAAKVILTFGYHDVYPDVPGYADCWGDTIIPCPFCDGYENRDLVWGIVPGEPQELEVFPKMAQNWTSKVKVLLPAGLEIDAAYRDELAACGIPVHDGGISEVHHNDGKVQAVTLDLGERVEVETLLWVPPEEPSPMIQKLANNLGLALDDSGYIKVDDMQRTNVVDLWAAGDVQGWMGALEAAAGGARAAADIVRGWYEV